MSDHFSTDKLIKDLQEREKELNCLYNIREIFNREEDIDKALLEATEIIPKGWQYPESCTSKIVYNNDEYLPKNFRETQWYQKADIEVNGEKAGEVYVYYTEEMPHEDEGPFLKQERKLLENIADRIGKFIFHIVSKKIIHEWEVAKEALSGKTKAEWQVVVELIRRTDQKLFIYLSRKMTYYLSWNGIQEAQELLRNFGTNLTKDEGIVITDEDMNKPSRKVILDMVIIGVKVFGIAQKYLNEEEILHVIQRWMQESKINIIVRTIVNMDTSLPEIIEAVQRFHHVAPNPDDLPRSTQKILNVSLSHRLFTDQLDFIKIAKDFVDMNHFYDLLKRVVCPTRSRGRIGGKSAGMIVGSQIIKKMSDHSEILKNIKVPKTWYITSDGMLDFVYANSLEEVVDQKYKEIDRVRLEYPHIIQIFKNSSFQPEILKGLSIALDDFGDSPLIVRSSSLLEDRLGTAFSGKYKSLFLANQGTKTERLEALTDAIAEVYASIFGPDPIEYRAERSLLDFHEEMGIMIQEVVGTKVGKYYLPSYAGVAFSKNEFRWSPRIKRDDGLIRLVPGLGTRAVDRLSHDYPVLIAPGQPKLKVNVSLDEVIRYSPQEVDVINLETNTFESINFANLVREHGNEIPNLKNMVSIIKGDRLLPPGFMTDYTKEEFIVNFEGLRDKTQFLEQIYAILNVLEENMKTPVDIEFASDGKDLYLLQCRPQSAGLGIDASLIPKDIPKDKILFTADKFVSNGRVPDITHLVYVDGQKYGELGSRAELLDVGRAVSQLNKILPKRQFILIGPGRWGSRGDIKLGVSVTYSDINNTAALIEVATQKGNYVPELSFGTHFFQDLVEASIRYLPLYPDAGETIFNSDFLMQSPNILQELVPDFKYLEECVRVIDVQKITNGNVIRMLTNAESDEAIAYIDAPTKGGSLGESFVTPKHETNIEDSHEEDYWRWRLTMATQIASQINPEKFGVKGFYLIGSTKNATAGPASDIDIIIHVHDDMEKQQRLRSWLDGWSYCLDEMNYQKTGYRCNGLLDVHYLTDEDIEKRTSFAIKIGAVTDPARQLPIGT